jgi:hypothetical protein
MMRQYLNNISASVLLFCLSVFPGCDKKKNDGTGFLEGKISIGPICPVETIPPDPACLPTTETYRAYPVSVWTSSGGRKIAQLNPSLDGSYKTELGIGNYLVVLESGKTGIGSSNLPLNVSIIQETTTTLNISIDTGIR